MTGQLATDPTSNTTVKIQIHKLPPEDMAKPRVPVTWENKASLAKTETISRTTINELY